MRLKLQPKETSNTFLFYLIFCRSISVECKLHKDRKFRLLCSLLFLQCLEQCVEHRRCSRNIYWLKEWINEWTWPKVYCDFAIDCLRKVVAGEFWTLDFAAFPSINQCWVQSEGDLNSRRFRRMRGGGGGRRTICPHSTWRQGSVPFPVTWPARRPRAPPRACALRRGCEALRGEAPPPAPPRGPVRAEAPPQPPSRSWDPWFLAGGRREPCRSGSGAARSARTAAGRVSGTSRARSLQLSRPGPLPRGRPLRSGGSRRPSPAPHARGRDEEEPGRPWGGTRPGPVRAGRAGGRRPPVPPVPRIPSIPGRQEAAGTGPLPQQEGAWAIRGKANYRSKVRASSRLRPPEAAGVTSPPHSHPDPLPARGPCLEWATPPASVPRDSPEDPLDDFPAPAIPAPAPAARIPGTSGSCKRHQCLGGNACVKFGDLNGLRSN